MKMPMIHGRGRCCRSRPGAEARSGAPRGWPRHIISSGADRGLGLAGTAGARPLCGRGRIQRAAPGTGIRRVGGYVVSTLWRLFKARWRASLGWCARGRVSIRWRFGSEAARSATAVTTAVTTTTATATTAATTAGAGAGAGFHALDDQDHAAGKRAPATEVPRGVLAVVGKPVGSLPLHLEVDKCVVTCGRNQVHFRSHVAVSCCAQRVCKQQGRSGEGCKTTAIQVVGHRIRPGEGWGVTAVPKGQVRHTVRLFLRQRVPLALRGNAAESRTGPPRWPPLVGGSDAAAAPPAGWA